MLINQWGKEQLPKDFPFESLAAGKILVWKSVRLIRRTVPVDAAVIPRMTNRLSLPKVANFSVWGVVDNRI